MENEPQQIETSTQPAIAATKPVITSGRQLLRQSLGFTFTNFWPLFAISLLSGLVALPSLILALYLDTQLDSSLAVQYGLAILVTVLGLVGSIASMTMATRATMHAGEWRLSAILGSLGQLWWPLSLTIFFAYAVMGAGFIFFIIPGIAFTVFLLPIMWVVAVEGLRGKAALVRSITLVSQYWWTVFGRLCFLGLVCLLAFVAGLLAVVVFSPAAFFLYMINETFALIVSVSGAVAVYLVTATFATFVMMRYSLLLYEDLVQATTVEKTPSRWSGWPLSVFLVIGSLLGVLYLLALPYLTLEDMRENTDEPLPWEASLEEFFN